MNMLRALGAIRSSGPVRAPNQRALVTGALILLAPTVTLSAQTIPEMAAALEGKRFKQQVLFDVQARPLEELVAGADVIVQGRLVRLHSYLSQDRKHVYTDYEIVASRFIRQQSQPLVQVPKLGAALIVQVYGGELTVNGTHVIVIDDSRADWSGEAQVCCSSQPRTKSRASVHCTVAVRGHLRSDRKDA